MISIGEKNYEELAALLLEALRETPQSYFNGSVEYDGEGFYSTLTCSLIVYRRGEEDENGRFSTIEDIVPVWWEYSVCADGVGEPNDFSWNELKQRLF